MKPMTSRISVKLIQVLAVVGISIAIVASGIQIFYSFRTGVSDIHQVHQSIRKTHTEPLSHSIWIADQDQIKLMLNSLLERRYVDRLVLAEAGETLFDRQKGPFKATIITTIPLRYDHRGEMVTVGELRIESGTERIIDDMKRQVIRIVVTHLLQYLILSAAILILFKVAVVGRLDEFAKFIKSQVNEKRDQPFRYSQMTPILNQHDEIDEVIDAYNTIHSLLKEKEQALLNHQVQLEAEVEERTEDLKIEIDRRIQYEAFLRASQTQLETILRTSNEGFVQIGPDLKVIKVNEALCAILGMMETEIAGVEALPLVKKITGIAYDDVIPRLMKGEVVKLDMTLTDTTGKTIPCLVSATPLFNENGDFDGAFAMMTDVSELKRAEEQMSAQKKMLQAILDSIEDAAFLMRHDGVILFANQAVENGFGCGLEGLVGKKYKDFLPQELAEQRMAMMNQVLATGKSIIFEDVWDELAREHKVYPFLSPVDEDHGVAVLSIDITERKQREEDLKKLWRAVEQSPVSIVITNPDGEIEYVNPYFCQKSGYTLEEAIGNTPALLKSQVHDASFYQNMWQVISSGKFWRGEMCNVKKNGESFWEQVSISPVFNSDNVIIHYIAVKEDISEKKEMERMKGDVERIMRHDLKTPLNSIIGFPQVLLRSDNLTERQKGYCKIIENSGNRMLNMINLYLSMFKMESGTFEYLPVQIDLLDTIRGVFDDLRSESERKKVTARILISGLAPEANENIIVTGEKLLLYTAFSNLIKNAIEASPKEEEVMVNISLEGEMVRIDILNRGAVPVSIRARFFEKYATEGKDSGTGLGTYSAKLMIETMLGSVEMTVIEERETNVSIILPIS